MFAAKTNCIFWRFTSISFLILYVLFIQRAFAFSHANELKAFADFMSYGNLKHGIILHNGSLYLTKKEIDIFFGKYYLRYFPVSENQSKSEFTNIFDGSFSRAGVFVPNLENDLIHHRVLKMASVNGLLNNSNAWFIVSDDKSSNIDFIRKQLGNLQIKVNADVTVAVRKKNLLLYDVYKIGTLENTPLNVEFKGNWSLDIGLSILPKFREGLVRRRRNLHNSTVRAGTFLLEKPTNISRLEHLQNAIDNRHFDLMPRKTYSVIRMIEPLFNMSIQVIFSDTWGIQLPNGTWTGVIGDIVTHNTEFSVCPLRYSAVRAEVLSFTPELHTEPIRFLFRHPRRATIRNIFFEPLSTTVWWCILALTIFLIIQLGVYTRLEYHAQKTLHHDEKTQIEPRWDFVVLQILEAIFLQGPSPEIYTFLSTRTFIISICIFSIMLQQFYSAFIVGSLLAAPSRTITTLEALYNSSLEIGMEEIAYNYEFFMNSTNQLVRNMYAKRICKSPARNILTIEQGVERIGHGGFAFHVSLNRAYRLLIAQLSESAFCDLQEIAVYPPFTVGLGALRGATYREYLATGILLIRETGLLRYSDKQWVTQLTDCSLVQNNEVDVDMAHFAPALVLLAIAMCISLIALLIELIWKWREKQNKKSSLKNLKPSYQRERKKKLTVKH